MSPIPLPAVLYLHAPLPACSSLQLATAPGMDAKSEVWQRVQEKVRPLDCQDKEVEWQGLRKRPLQGLGAATHPRAGAFNGDP